MKRFIRKNKWLLIGLTGSLLQFGALVTLVALYGWVAGVIELFSIIGTTLGVVYYLKDRGYLDDDHHGQAIELDNQLRREFPDLFD